MKARVKATGEIVEITEDDTSLYAANFYKSYSLDELEFLYVKEKSLPKDEPDYWEKLKHQYAGMAMQGLISNNTLLTALCNGNKDSLINEIVADNANLLASALIEKLKNEK